jgi:D-xylose reductase
MSKATIKLASGRLMPLVDFGLWKVPRDSAADTVYEVSTRYIGHANVVPNITPGHKVRIQAVRRSIWLPEREREAGEGVRRAIDEGLVKREEIFITTKVWNNYHSIEHALPMFRKQNEAWGLEYIELLLIHFSCALEYVDPEKKRYPVSRSSFHALHRLS